MSTKNKLMKPTKFQMDTIKKLNGSSKNINSYQDAKNYIKRLRYAAKKTNKKITAKPGAKLSNAKSIKASTKCNNKTNHTCTCKHKKNSAKKNTLPVIKNGCGESVIRVVHTNKEERTIINSICQEMLRILQDFGDLFTKVNCTH